ncbi:MAG: adenylate/guanylate cyclase domain-containing protein [Pirellulaceae bacterium]
MADLIAQGAEPHQRWRRRLTPNTTHWIGRAAAGWAVPWDDRISRRHSEVQWRDGALWVSKRKEAQNPVFFRGRSEDHFSLRPGEHFVIGGTSFHVTEDRVDVSRVVPAPVTEQAFPKRYLRQVRFRDAEQRIDILSRLPEIISGSVDDADLFVRLVSLLLHGVPRAGFVAVVRPSVDSADRCGVELLHWDSRVPNHARFSPSVHLIQEAFAKDESLLHVWKGPVGGDAARFTQSDNVDWAFCTPVSSEFSPSWAIYVAGSSEQDASFDPCEPDQLRDDLKFTELTAATVARVRDLRRFERREATLSQFISPIVLQRLAEQDPVDVLAPREVEVSVLFCDLRGFSRESERAADDLMGLLHRVSGALGVMTHQILEQGGVVGDFHGDAAMGFWGWPLAQEDSVPRACSAALAIRAEFRAAGRQDAHPLADFQMGIGIATGPAVAGKIGTLDQVKITVFGPVVNLAARLEGMTKQLRAPILIDETTANVLRQTAPASVARVRRVAKVRPFGLEVSLEVSELLPPESVFPSLNDGSIATYEAALDALTAGDWSQAFALLHHVPAEDRVKDFLTVFIAQHNRTPPKDWDGVIDMRQK